MDRADALLVFDIASAAAKEAATSACIKIEALPPHLRTHALLIAMMMLARKAKSIREVIPGAEAVWQIIDAAGATDVDALRERLERDWGGVMGIRDPLLDFALRGTAAQAAVDAVLIEKGTGAGPAPLPNSDMPAVAAAGGSGATRSVGSRSSRPPSTGTGETS